MLSDGQLLALAGLLFGRGFEVAPWAPWKWPVRACASWTTLVVQKALWRADGRVGMCQGIVEGIANPCSPVLGVAPTILPTWR